MCECVSLCVCAYECGWADDEPEREHSTIWQVEMPPLLESATGDMEDEITLQTLEERILRRYTPSRLDMDAYTVPQKAAFVAHTSGGLDDNSHESSPIKPCPACFGVGKVRMVVCGVYLYSHTACLCASAVRMGCLDCVCLGHLSVQATPHLPQMSNRMI